MAFPLAALPRGPSLWDRLGAVVAERCATRLVVGLPVRARGDEGPAAAAAREFAAEAERRLGLPTELWDERFTTVAAMKSLDAAGVSRKRQRGRIDSAAAAVLLDSWLQREALRPGRS